MDQKQLWCRWMRERAVPIARNHEPATVRQLSPLVCTSGADEMDTESAITTRSAAMICGTWRQVRDANSKGGRRWLLITVYPFCVLMSCLCVCREAFHSWCCVPCEVYNQYASCCLAPSTCSRMLFASSAAHLFSQVPIQIDSSTRPRRWKRPCTEMCVTKQS